MPAYWLLVITSLLVFDRERLGDGWRIVRLATVQHVAHWMDLRVDPGSVSDGAQTWSLATEVRFQLALPLIAFVPHRALSARHGVRLALALLASRVSSCSTPRRRVASAPPPTNGRPPSVTSPTSPWPSASRHPWCSHARAVRRGCCPTPCSPGSGASRTGSSCGT
ncbi:hypothetical protein [Streptomyces violascens]|uniref:hypothetical protein n=1 Tax=Streptomyces violascens TaxID=67381 RepID=UPI0036696010